MLCLYLFGLYGCPLSAIINLSEEGQINQTSERKGKEEISYINTMKLELSHLVFNCLSVVIFYSCFTGTN